MIRSSRRVLDAALYTSFNLSRLSHFCAAVATPVACTARRAAVRWSIVHTGEIKDCVAAMRAVRVIDDEEGDQVKTIYKYNISDYSTLGLSKDHRILFVGLQDNQTKVWVETDPTQSVGNMDEVVVVAIGTGHPLRPEFPHYINSVFDGPYVWHFYTNGTVASSSTPPEEA